jgi:beta-1,4-mannosyl-glycoprotein beta-1,4-N-acetylglucosaminyltransferase
MPMGMLWTRNRIYFHALREIHQRNCIDRGIQRLQLNADDLILISDIDEIPNRDVLHTTLPADICGFSQDFYYYNFTCKNKSKWTHARVLKYRAYALIRKCQHIRGMRAPVIENGGWHLSYFGNAEFIANKIRNFMHQEYNLDVFTDLSNIQDKIDKGIDIFGRQNEEWIHVIEKCPIADYF